MDRQEARKDAARLREFEEKNRVARAEPTVAADDTPSPISSPVVDEYVPKSLEELAKEIRISIPTGRGGE